MDKKDEELQSTQEMMTFFEKEGYSEPQQIGHGSFNILLIYF